MIDKYNNFKFVIFEVVVQSFKGFNYSKQFLIVSFISSFYQNHFSWNKGYKMSLARLQN